MPVGIMPGKTPRKGHRIAAKPKSVLKIEMNPLQADTNEIERNDIIEATSPVRQFFGGRRKGLL
jgi:hypothetical protein